MSCLIFLFQSQRPSLIGSSVVQSGNSETSSIPQRSHYRAVSNSSASSSGSTVSSTVSEPAMPPPQKQLCILQRSDTSRLREQVTSRLAAPALNHVRSGPLRPSSAHQTLDAGSVESTTDDDRSDDPTMAATKGPTTKLELLNVRGDTSVTFQKKSLYIPRGRQLTAMRQGPLKAGVPVMAVHAPKESTEVINTENSKTVGLKGLLINLFFMSHSRLVTLF